MRKYLLITLLFFIIFFIDAQIASVPFTPESFNIDVIQYSHMIKIDNKNSAVVDTHYNFTDLERSYEIRYSLFRQTEKNSANIREAFTIFSIMVIYNMAGYEVDLSGFIFYDDNDVKNDFNGNFGMTGVIQNPVSDYGSGYAYLLVSMFYKENQGIVAMVIMSNDVNFFLDIESQKLHDVFHSFKFRN